ncbi:hypothetical protein MJT46_010795 [Ovis ammon polii x Ovis aries]|nr:hypothetical protein MJT46_010795 [Ovis ammon polii x Ovis aries]
MPADRRARQDLRPGKSWRSAICWVTAPGSRFGVTRVPAPQKPSPSAGRDTSPQHRQLLPKPSGLRLAHLRWLRGEPGGSGRAPLRCRRFCSQNPALVAGRKDFSAWLGQAPPHLPTCRLRASRRPGSDEMTAPSHPTPSPTPTPMDLLRKPRPRIL